MTEPSTAIRRAVFVALALVVVWLGVVHHQTGDFGAWPPGTPTTLHFDGRDYRRGVQETSPTGATVREHRWGGGEIMTLPGAGTSTVVWVRDGSTTYAYGLLGGP